LVSYSTSDFKPGLKILIDGEPCEIIEEEFVRDRPSVKLNLGTS